MGEVLGGGKLEENESEKITTKVLAMQQKGHFFHFFPDSCQ